MTTDTKTVDVALAKLREFGERVYRQVGLSPEDAALVVDVQLEADLRGVDTHGFQRLPWYVEYIRKGENNPRPNLRVLKETPWSLVVDADNAIGQLACARVMTMTIEKAKSTGLAVGTLRNSNDWGCGAYYPMLAAKEGFVAFCTTTSVPTLAPFGALTRLSGNNPMAFAVPRRDAPPIVLDMALTPVALGKVLRARAEGTTIPESWGFLDREGRPATDPATALSGVIPAIGGYKGTGLSLMMNVLAGILPGGHHTAEVKPGRRGQFFLVISPSLFGETERFYDEVESMARQVKEAERLPGVEEVYLPGEIEQRTYEQRAVRGVIAYPGSVVAGLVELGRSLGIAFAP
ncbi:MAG TPA: Ldh family oxidoreductase [Dehalococcoidia bacterium]|nr:Ldh family oxidoreductase [Dehalococcoidia bacterium]